MGAGDQNLAMEDGSTLKLYPNPNRGEQLYLSLDAIEEGVNTVSVDIFDLLGLSPTDRLSVKKNQVCQGDSVRVNECSRPCHRPRREIDY